MTFKFEKFFENSLHIVIFGSLVAFLIPEVTFVRILPLMFGYCVGQAIANIRRV
jgi:hypothetical protein